MFTKKLTDRIDKLEKKMEDTFSAVGHLVNKKAKETVQKSMAAINAWKKSEQIKYNRIDARVMDLERCFKAELSHYRKTLENQEMAAAEEAERLVGK